jgi:hypothetical protein
MDKRAPIIVARAWTDSEASVIKSLLLGYNIPCHYSSEIPHRIYPVSVQGLAEIRIFVPAILAPEALRVLDAHRRHSHNANLRLVESDDLEIKKA